MWGKYQRICVSHQKSFEMWRMWRMWSDHKVRHVLWGFFFYPEYVFGESTLNFVIEVLAFPKKNLFFDIVANVQINNLPLFSNSMKKEHQKVLFTLFFKYFIFKKKDILFFELCTFLSLVHDVSEHYSKFHFSHLS